jgi:WD40-like Beta Propeller Repeat
MKKIIFCLALVSSSVSFAQMTEAEVRKMVETASEQELVEQSSRMLMEGYYYHGEIVADKLLTKNAVCANYNYRKGFVLMDGYKDFIGALPYLKKAEGDLDKNYDMYSSNEKSAPQDVLFFIAQCYHTNHQLDEARTYYNKFIAQSNSKSPFVAKSALALKQVEVAKRNLELPGKLRLKNLGPVINTALPEYSPVVSLDGSALYFTSRREWPGESEEASRDPRTNEYPEDVYVAFTDVEGKWEQPIKLEFCVPEQNEATMAVSSDERRVYLYQDTKGNGDVFFSDFESNKFGRVENFDVKEINTKFWETHMHVSPDGQSMFFVSDRPGGFGGRDIYLVRKLPDGAWSKPMNLGPNVNSKYDEESPFVAIDNKTLYFSSNGDKSMGGFDVFVAVKDAEGIWSSGINLGSPLNSCGDDLFYTTTIDGLTGYLTSWRAEGKGNKDIYEIKNDYQGLNNIAVLKGEVITLNDAPLPEDVAMTINCLNCGNEISRTVFPRLRDGTFFSALEPCRQYEIIYHYAGGKTEFYRETIETSCEKAYQEINRKIYLDVEKMKVVPKDPEIIAVVPKEDPKVTPKEDPKVTPKEDPKDKKFTNPEYKNTFGYNENDKNFRRGDLVGFVAEIEKQMKEGRPTITLEIFSSASKVTTATFKNNQVLAETRANNMKAELTKLLETSPDLAKRINIVIVSASVNGPEYTKGSKDDVQRYYPFQYVIVKTK